MGTELRGTVTVGGQKVPVKGDFASDHVTFSGGRRGEVPYTKVVVVSTAKGILKLRVDDTPMEFEVGKNVDRLANKIRSPPTLLDKLGVKAGMRVAALHVPRDLVSQLPPKRVEREADLCFFGVTDVEGLEGLSDAATRLAAGGALWVVYPKGRRDIRESDVLAAGRAAGLVDTKVARISPKSTALRFTVRAMQAAGPVQEEELEMDDDVDDGDDDA